MDKKRFRTFCREEFEKRGFKKQNKTFYLLGKDLLCGLELSKSNYGNEYYVDFFYCIGDYRDAAELPDYYDSDIEDRILAMSKTKTVHGKCFLTAMIEYEEYTEDELRPYFDKEFEERILPPVYQGKKYILDQLGKLYSLTLHKEEVMRKLKS